MLYMCNLFFVFRFTLLLNHLLGVFMRDKISKKFLNDSLEVIKENPDLEERLKSVMGKVADTVLKKKYVTSDDNIQNGESIRDEKLD